LQADAQGDLPTAGAILLRRTRRHHDRVAPGWVSGVALMVRRAEFLAVGGFDPAFFMYYEDVDLCRRYRARGLELERVVEACVVHEGGRSRVSARAQKRAYDRSQDLYLTRIGTAWPLRLLVRMARAVARACGGDPMRSR
jgi:N-acetylglucosaminyl-diphospho-decaprenol L-rhamnosyltransferase